MAPRCPPWFGCLLRGPLRRLRRLRRRSLLSEFPGCSVLPGFSEFSILVLIWRSQLSLSSLIYVVAVALFGQKELTLHCEFLLFAVRGNDGVKTGFFLFRT